jgi:hypothetical protein
LAITQPGGWRYSHDCDNERFNFAAVLVHESPSLSQSNANRHYDRSLIVTNKCSVNVCSNKHTHGWLHSFQWT